MFDIKLTPILKNKRCTFSSNVLFDCFKLIIISSSEVVFSVSCLILISNPVISESTTFWCFLADSSSPINGRTFPALFCKLLITSLSLPFSSFKLHLVVSQNARATVYCSSCNIKNKNIFSTRCYIGKRGTLCFASVVSTFSCSISVSKK